MKWKDIQEDSCGYRTLLNAIKTEVWITDERSARLAAQEVRLG
jgi:hypothetical protein